jgi:zinc resistance-associated protein
MTHRTGKTILVIGIIALFTAAAGTAMAWGPGGCGKGGPRGFCRGAGEGGWGQAADLNQDQQNQLRELQRKFVDETAGARASMIAKYDAARALLSASEPDRAALVALADEVQALKRSIMEKRIDFALAAKKISPDLSLPLDARGEGRFHGMGMGAYGAEGAAGCPGFAGCPGATDGPRCGRGWMSSQVLPGTQAQVPGCPGARGCQGAAQGGCPGYTQPN